MYHSFVVSYELLFFCLLGQVSKLFGNGETTPIKNSWTKRQRSCNHWDAAVVCKNGTATGATGRY